jgi:antitoxin (DNA-binding transcriptional repressor) of toxin-antitoxin stability system
MKRSIEATVPQRRLGVTEAKSKLSEALRHIDEGPTVIQSRGRDVAILISVDECERLLSVRRSRGPTGGAAFLERVEALKLRHGGGVEGFEPEPLRFV